MTLGQKQEAFAISLASLITFATHAGYGVRLRELERTKEQAELYAKEGKGILNSNHRNCLAIDLYLTAAGELLWDGPAYEALATHWKSLSRPDLDHCWGGDFRKYRDVYHFSIKHNGVV